jgi:signal transduction histidine kinase
LPLVRSIVEAHGGTVQLVSVLGVGTTVTMWLPGFAPRAVRAETAIAAR